MEDLQQKKVVIRVKKGGAMTYEVQGVKGSSCMDLTKELDNLGEVGEVCLTSEHYEDEKNNLIVSDIEL